MPKLTLWFLQASRSIRVAWVLEELGLDYELKFSNRENGLAPDSFKQEAGDLGKFPMLQDGDLCLAESGMITEYQHQVSLNSSMGLTFGVKVSMRYVRQAT